MRARYYDPAAGAFLSRDPIAASDPQSVNPYQALFGNPFRYVDPVGTSPESIIQGFVDGTTEIFHCLTFNAFRSPGAAVKGAGRPPSLTPPPRGGDGGRPPAGGSAGNGAAQRSAGCGCRRQEARDAGEVAYQVAAWAEKDSEFHQSRESKIAWYFFIRAAAGCGKAYNLNSEWGLDSQGEAKKMDCDCFLCRHDIGWKQELAAIKRSADLLDQSMADAVARVLAGGAEENSPEESQRQAATDPDLSRKSLEKP
jgi:hypothetical protein